MVYDLRGLLRRPSDCTPGLCDSESVKELRVGNPSGLGTLKVCRGASKNLAYCPPLPFLSAISRCDMLP